MPSSSRTSRGRSYLAAGEDRRRDAEERRLFYVGLTRARRHLWVTWRASPSRFLAARRHSRAGAAARARPGDPMFAALKHWRLERARADDVPAYVVFHNSTLAEVAGRAAIAQRSRCVPGVGPTKLERYGDDVLSALVRAGRPEG